MNSPKLQKYTHIEINSDKSPLELTTIFTGYFFEVRDGDRKNMPKLKKSSTILIPLF